jgi:hypothetical protein
MFMVQQLFELLSVNKKLNASKPHVLSALSGLAVVILLGAFGSFLSAMMVCAVLWLLYSGMITAGAALMTAALVTGGVTLVLLAVTVYAALRVWASVRGEVERVFEAQKPMLSPVMDTAGNVANAFISGLRRKTAAK